MMRKMIVARPRIPKRTTHNLVVKFVKFSIRRKPKEKIHG